LSATFSSCKDEAHQHLAFSSANLVIVTEYQRSAALVAVVPLSATKKSYNASYATRISK